MAFSCQRGFSSNDRVCTQGSDGRSVLKSIIWLILHRHFIQTHLFVCIWQMQAKFWRRVSPTKRELISGCQDICEPVNPFFLASQKVLECIIFASIKSNLISCTRQKYIGCKCCILTWNLQQIIRLAFAQICHFNQLNQGCLTPFGLVDMYRLI